MQLHRWKRFGHRYLGRMMWTSLLLILLPCLIALFVMMQQSYTGVLNHTRGGYTTAVRDFSQEFIRRLDQYRTDAARLAIDSRESGSPLYVLQQERSEENAYYYTEMRDALASYGVAHGCKVSVYFCETDALVSGSGKYTAATFSHWASDTYAPQDEAEFTAFLQEAQIDGTVGMFSTIDRPGGVLQISVATRVGLSKKPAKVLFTIKSGELNTISLLSQLGQAAQLAVYRSDGQMVYATDTLYPQWSEVPGALTDNRADFQYDGATYELFQTTDELDFRYVLLLPYRQLSYSLEQFYRMQRTVILLSGVVLLLAVLSTVSINYVPIFRTVTKYGVEHERDEFEAIAKSFDMITTENSDKEMLIMDLLYRNMLYGVPIPSAQAVRLQRTGAQAFCVMTLSPLRMTSEECGRLTGELYEQLQIQTYMTDLLPEERTVVICFMNESVADRLAEVTGNWLGSAFPDSKIGVYVGTVVSTINEIHQSFRACDAQEKAQPTEPPVQEMDTLAQNILDFIKANYADLNLSRTMVADHFRISVYSLSRVFKNQLNIGFAEYLTNCRLEHVVSRLLMTEQTLTEISDACGFASASYLAKLFRSVYNMTPMQYRKAERQKRGLPTPAQSP